MDLFQIYLVCFGVGFLFAVLSALLADVSGGHGEHPGHFHHGTHELHGDHQIGSHGMPGFSPISPTTIACFLTAFGGAGMIFSRIGVTSSAWFSVPLAALCGLILSFLVYLVFDRIFRATQSSSEGHVQQLIGQSATVITPIQPGGVGEIAYVQGGTRYTAPARADEAMPIVSGTTVWIVRVHGSHFHVQLI